MAQSAVGAIRAGCQMLSEGRQELGKFKTQVEGGITDAKAIYSEVIGLWGWFTRLFNTSVKNVGAEIQQTKAIQSAVSQPNTSSRKTEISFEEFQARAVHEICENLKVYFEAIRQLKIHCRELEEEALTTEKVADSAIDRIEIQWQMQQLSAQLRQSMIYGTPESLGLGALYQKFLAKQDEILEEQEVARALKVKKERANAWQHEHRNQILIAKLSYVAVIVIVILELIGLFLAL